MSNDVDPALTTAGPYGTVTILINNNVYIFDNFCYYVICIHDLHGRAYIYFKLKLSRNNIIRRPLFEY